MISAERYINWGGGGGAVVNEKLLNETKKLDAFSLVLGSIGS